MNYSMAPKQASNFAYQYDVLFYVTTGLTILFTLLVCTLIVFFAVKYRRGTKVDRSRPHHEHLMLEIAWTVIPTILGLVMFVFGTKLFIQMRTPPKDAQDIFVIGKQWMWHVQHPNGVRENNTLHVPVGQPVKLTMISQDVIHAFYIPDFRVQFHVVPGRYTHLWFTATKPGRYPLYCGMYCGTQHSEMGGYVYAMDPKDYSDWLNNGGNNVGALSMEQRGERIYKVLGCDNGSCHASADTVGAPSVFGIYGKQRPTNEGIVTADDAYLREAILRPGQKLTRGYENTMPTYDKQLDERSVLDLIAYMKNLHPGTNVASVPASAQGTRGDDLAVGAIAATKRLESGEHGAQRTVDRIEGTAGGKR